MPAAPQEACAFGDRLESRSVFFLDPRLVTYNRDRKIQ